MEWCAPQDWMCEPDMIQKTGLTVREHQVRSVRSFMHLRHDGLPVIPVLQGWTLGEYMDCVELYDMMGVDLRREPLVGLGSVCRRQSNFRGPMLVDMISRMGIRLHGFGFKATGLTAGMDLGEYAAEGEHTQLVSADSMAWSTDARWVPPLPGHAKLHQHCNNCIDYAMEWRRKLLAKSSRGMIV